LPVEIGELVVVSIWSGVGLYSYSYY